MDEDFLAEALGFTITEKGDLVHEGQTHRSVTIAELMMWTLLKKPQAEWGDVLAHDDLLVTGTR
jgi:hypothetical protein